MTKDFDHPRLPTTGSGVREPVPPRIVPDGYGDSTIPAVIREMFKLLPPAGTQWQHAERGAFLKALSSTFDIIYGSTDFSASLPKTKRRT